MIEISALFVYPVKSCRGTSLQEVEIGRRGFRHDREFLVVDAGDSFLTQRTAPELATVDVAIDEADLVLRAADAGELRAALATMPGETRPQREVTIFRDRVLADDMGDAAAEWFSAVLHQRCRLVRAGAAAKREVPSSRLPASHRTAAGTPISFPDAFPTLLTSEASLADLNTRLPQPIPIGRFRPNIVVRGGAPYEEDTWSSIRAGEVAFGCADVCLRCIIATTDQATGCRDGDEPLRTLATYRRAPDRNGVMFGRYLVHSAPGRLRVGDLVLPEP